MVVVQLLQLGGALREALALAELLSLELDSEINQASKSEDSDPLETMSTSL